MLVERIEGFCAEADWMRAYGEINDFENALVHAVDSLARVARDVASADGRTVAVDRTALWWAETTLELLGEESEAAVARVAMRWDAALRLREH